MSKKLIRKGLAVSATVALAFTGFAALPANAAGLADTSFVSLVPKTGTEYAVPANANQTFTLTANEASSIEGTNRNLKFLVSDPSGVVETTAATSGRTGFTTTTSDTWTRAATGGEVTVTDAAGAAAGNLAVGDRISVSGTVFPADTLPVDAGVYTITAVAANGTSFSFNDGKTGAPTGTTTPAAENIRVVREARDTTANTFVVDTGSFTASTTSDLVLTVAGGTTRTVEVTAWVDNNGNDVIDPTEYVSPTRTVSFLAAADITVNTTIDPLVLGATSMVAKVSTVPVLNGNQFNSNLISAVFTRQGSAVEKSQAAAGGLGAAWNNTTKVWTITNDLTDISGGNWDDLSSANTAPVTATSYAGGNLTITTAYPHGLANTNTTTLSGFTAATNNPNGSRTAIAGTTGSTLVITVAEPTTLVSTSGVVTVRSAVAGQYSAKGVITVNSVAKAGAVVGATLGARNAVAVENVVATSADVANTSATGALVRTTVKTVSLSAAAEDVNEKAVGAGIPATITATFSSAGTVKVNGTTVTTGGVVNALTDASGKVAVSVENSAAAAGNAITIVVNVQGATASTTFTWAAAEYSMVDSGDSSIASSRVRAANKGGSYTFNLNVIDQWKQPLADGYRARVAATDRTVSTTFHNIVGGKVSFSVADGGVTANDTSVNVTVVPQTTATALADAAIVNWDGTGGNDLAVITIKWYDQTDVVSVTSTTAQRTSAVESLKTAALNKLTTTGFQASYTTAATIAGSVAGNVTGLKRAGASITISGPSTVLFNVGDVWAFGSLTFIDADGDYSVDAYSNTAMKDANVVVTSGSASVTTKVTFTALTAVDAKIATVKSIKAGRSTSITVSFVDKWGNLASDARTATIKSSGPGWLTNEVSQTSVAGIVTARLITQPGDFGPAIISATTNVNDLSGNAIVVSGATWVGPIANAKAGAKKGRVIVEAYRAKGKTVNVFVGKTRVASYKADKANFRKVVRGIKSGTRNISVRIVGPGEDFRGAITVK